MYKGLFKEKSTQETVIGNYKSYSNKQSPFAKNLVVCFAIIALAACGDKVSDSMFQTSKSAANAYRTYLSEVRTLKNLSTEELIMSINEWQSLRDSVFTRIGKDTTNYPHGNYESAVLALHNSLRIELLD